MKYPLLLLICLLTFSVKAQKKLTPQDSISVFYKELFSALKTGYIDKKTIDWSAVESETWQTVKQFNSFENSLNEIKPLFDKIAANHCIVFYNQKKYTATTKKIPNESYSEQWLKKYGTKPNFEAKVLDDKFGYILIPGMLFFDTSAGNINKIAQPLYNQIAELKTKNKIDGWIIDLRFNTGGNATPMLLSLYDLLGNNNVWGTLDVNKKQTLKYKLKDGEYLDGSKDVAYVNPKGALLDTAKVAVITGIVTASSGEVTALAFKDRANTVFIGEPTYGATTGNVSWPLPFNITMALTTSYDSDRNGNYYEKIIPDVLVSRQDNFDNLLVDKNIQEAIKFFSKKE